MIMNTFFSKNRVIFLVITWLIIVNIIGLVVNNRVVLTADTAYSWMSVEKYDQHQSWHIVDMHARWDSNWYVDIVKNGYQRKVDDTLSNLVFFPLYPFLMKVASFFVQEHIVLAGWIVSSIFLLLSCMIFVKLVEEFHTDVAQPLYAVFLLLIFPTAFFLNAVYTESLFLFLSISTFYFAFKRQYVWAGIFGFLAALTRVTGVLIFLPLVIHVWMLWRNDRELVKKAWALVLIPCGTMMFFLYHWIFYGDPLLFFTIESAWGRSFAINKDHFVFLTHASRANFFLDAFYLFFGVGVSVYLLKIRQYAYGIYMLSTIGVAVASGTLMSIGRYILVLFPIYIVGAMIKNDVIRYVWILISTMLMALNTYLFVNWYWAG